MDTVTQPLLGNTTYRLESVLGAGGGGVVYKAWHTRLQKPVVIKELKSGSRSDLETQRNEVEALKNVKSAYLPQVLDFLVEDGRVFTVMEFIEGSSFDKLLEAGRRFTAPQVVKWYGQLASALEAIHKQSICHRDIKPANIMLLPGGDVCLIDFNAALVRGNDVRLISRSLGYASPEQYAIYEQYRQRRDAPIRYTGSTQPSPPAPKTELLDEATELMNGQTTELMDSQATELMDGAQRNRPIGQALPETELMTPDLMAEIDWQRSDIYSLGATMYHLLTGVHPPERAAEVVPLSKLGHFSEGITFLIEQSMQRDPTQRFPGSAALAEAVSNIHKHDSRWLRARARRIAAAILLPAAFALCAGTAFYGRQVMAQEKEEQFYEAVYDIGRGEAPQVKFEEAVSLYWDRIDPYLAMAKRLQSDGELEACRSFVEENLGKIAEFQATPETAYSFGQIYYLLGDCYYDLAEPDYPAARGNFAIAVRFVTDDPKLYRDYAITLARTGEPEQARAALAQAEELGLGTDDLTLLRGELAFSERDDAAALEALQTVLRQSGEESLLYRAAHTLEELYGLRGEYGQAAAMLEGVLPRLPRSRLPEMRERLADAYTRSGREAEAIAQYEQLLAEGPPMFHLMLNLAILQENTGALDAAAAVLDEMADAFPGDYRVPMQQAYLEADRQAQCENESRDYTQVQSCYEAAAALYAQTVRPGMEDADMQRLEELIDQLRKNQWID